MSSAVSLPFAALVVIVRGGVVCGKDGREDWITGRSSGRSGDSSAVEVDSVRSGVGDGIFGFGATGRGTGGRGKDDAVGLLRYASAAFSNLAKSSKYRGGPSGRGTVSGTLAFGAGGFGGRDTGAR